jgi:hypothetical protein
MLANLSESTYICENFVGRNIQELGTHVSGTPGEMGAAIS